MQALLVKISSMGDLIHALPALTDAQAAIPDIKFDWVIEKSFQEVASWHPAVNQIIPSAHRVWKKNLMATFKSGEAKQFLKQLRSKRYDVIVDGQTSFKSACITRLARGPRAGLDSKSAREYGAHLAYSKRYFVPKEMHAVDRIRSLFAQALGYTCPTTVPDFGLQLSQFTKPNLELASPYLTFLVNASWLSKCYPESYWQSLIFEACQNYTVYMPWGSQKERERVERLAKTHPKAIALPRLSLSEVGYILAGSQGSISVDTGLGHLSAALNTPTVTLYGPTDPELIGATGQGQIYQLAEFDCLRCYQKKCNYQQKQQVDSACLLALTPDKIWQQLQTIVRESP